MKVVSPPPISTDPLLRLVRRAMMEEARAELVKARLEKCRVAAMVRRRRRGRDQVAGEAVIAPAKSGRRARRKR